MTQEQAAFLASILLQAIQDEVPKTRRVIQAVPPDKCSYSPHPNSRTALELAWHIASADVWFLDAFLSSKFEMEDDNMPADFKDCADVAAWYDESIGVKIEKVSKLPPSFWATPLPFFGIYNYPPALYLQFMLLHMVHHRGQLTAYLRPMGAKVPNIYGGSFDEPMAPPPGV